MSENIVGRYHIIITAALEIAQKKNEIAQKESEIRGLVEALESNITVSESRKGFGNDENAYKALNNIDGLVFKDHNARYKDLKIPIPCDNVAGAGSAINRILDKIKDDLRQ